MKAEDLPCNTFFFVDFAVVTGTVTIGNFAIGNDDSITVDVINGLLAILSASTFTNNVLSIVPSLAIGLAMVKITRNRKRLKLKQTTSANEFT